MLDIKTMIELLKGRSPAEKAKISSHLLAPGLVLGLTMSGAVGGTFGIDAAQPITVCELRTEISANGNATPKPGFALIVEPITSEYRIPLGSQASQLWSSLDEQAAGANKERLRVDGSAVSGKTPLLGVGGPVTVVVEGKLGSEIQLPGGTEKIDNLLLQPRRSVSIVSGVLLACVFAFGMSLATGLPSIDRNKHTAG